MDDARRAKLIQVTRRHRSERPLRMLSDDELWAVSKLCEQAIRYGSETIVTRLGDIPDLATHEEAERLSDPLPDAPTARAIRESPEASA